MDDLEKFLNIDCNILPLITFRDVAALNHAIVEPSQPIDFQKIDPEITDEQAEKMGDYKIFLNETIERFRKDPEFDTGYENDRYNLSMDETLEVLLEVKLSYICQNNSNLFHLAAHIMHTIASGHPFEEGNKRTAFTATCLFLITYTVNTNSVAKTIVPTLDEELMEMLRKIANNEDIDVDEVEEELRSRIEKDFSRILG